METHVGITAHSTKVYIFFPELKKALQNQEEETRIHEKEKDDLQDKINAMKGELSKTEQARKELIHKVSAILPMISTTGRLAFTEVALIVFAEPFPRS